MTRQHLPDERPAKVIKITMIEGYTHRGEQRTREYDCYIRPGYFEDGRLGEVFVTIGKRGGVLQGLMDQWAVAFSWLLQMGVPLEELAAKFQYVEFSPMGPVWHDGKRLYEAKSMVDAVVRVLVSLDEEGH